MFKVELTEQELKAVLYHLTYDLEACMEQHNWEELELEHSKLEAREAINKLYKAREKGDKEKKTNEKIDRKEVNYFINRLWDIAERYYPRYYGCNFIAELNDWYKIINEEEERNERYWN